MKDPAKTTSLKTMSRVALGQKMIGDKMLFIRNFFEELHHNLDNCYGTDDKKFRDTVASLQVDLFRSLIMVSDIFSQSPHEGQEIPINYAAEFIDNTHGTPQSFDQLMEVFYEMSISGKKDLAAKLPILFIEKHKQLTIFDLEENDCISRGLIYLSSILDEQGHAKIAAEYSTAIKSAVQYNQSSTLATLLDMEGGLSDVWALTPEFVETRKPPIRPKITKSMVSETISWLKENEEKIACDLLGQNPSNKLNSAIALKAHSHGMPMLGDMIRIRQGFYGTGDLLKYRSIGIKPDEILLDYLRNQYVICGTSGKYLSSISFLAYSIVEGDYNIDLMSIRSSPMVVAKKAIEIIFLLGEKPNNISIEKIIADVIDMASCSSDVEWLEKVTEAKEILIKNKKYQGLRFESELGL